MIAVIVDPTDLSRILFALEKVKSAVILWSSSEMPYKGAIDYRNLLIENIEGQRFAGGYTPYDERYEKWKGGGKFWVLKGDLLKSLSVFRHKKGWFSGVPKGAKDTGGKSWHYPRDSSKQGEVPPRSISMYGYYGEYGRPNKQPDRPVFGPTLVQYSRRGWRVRGDEALKSIGKSWG